MSTTATTTTTTDDYQITLYSPLSSSSEQQQQQQQHAVTSESLIYVRSSVPQDAQAGASALPPEAEQIRGLKQWRKGKSFLTGVGIGMVLLVALGGPIGGAAALVGVTGGMVSTYATRQVLKRREKKVVDKLMAMQYPLVYNEHAVYA